MLVHVEPSSLSEPAKGRPLAVGDTDVCQRAAAGRDNNRKPRFDNRVGRESTATFGGHSNGRLCDVGEVVNGLNLVAVGGASG